MAISGTSRSFSTLQITENDSSGTDISSLNNALSRRNFEEIIKDSELFWLAFCKAFSQLDGENSTSFAISLQGEKLIISGSIHVISAIQKCIEEIRKFFVKGNAKKNDFFMLPISLAQSIFIREKADTINLTDWLDDRQFRLYENWFMNFIKPTMQIFCESIGATCSFVVVPQKIIVDEYDGAKTKNIEGIKIEWSKQDYLTYPITPTTIPPRGDFVNSIYSKYENQELCDLSLVTEEGGVKVHSLFFLLYGGEAIKNMLTSDVKEAKDKTIHFNEFSLSTVKAFVDFIYLGEEGLEPKSILEKDVDLFELFEMAHTYQVLPLIDCSANLLTLFASTKDLERIQHYADLYENKHLEALSRHLQEKVNPNQPDHIKV